MIINDREDDIMKFIKYPSLTNHYAVQTKKCIDLNKEYVATEKIHGSNISIIVDKERNIDVAKRSDFLTDAERTQTPWKTLAEYAETNRELILSWFDKVCEHASKVAPVEQVNFYGELFGASTVKGAGDYDITLLGERTIRFFDIHVLFTDDRRLVLSQEQITQIVGEDKTAPVLREGVLHDLLISATELTSEFGKCIAEGQVYKPKDEYILTPDALGHINYPVVKHKYDEWLEKRNISVKKDMNYSANEIKLISAIKSRITKQRLLNIISHGEIEATEKNTGKFIKTMLADIKEEIIREEPEIEIESNKLFGKHGGEVAKLYRDYLVELGRNY